MSVRNNTKEVTCIDAQRLGALHQLRQPLLGLADEYGRGERHAALAGRPEGGAHQLVDGVLLVGVGHHHAVVLGSLRRGNVGHHSTGDSLHSHIKHRQRTLLITSP